MDELLRHLEKRIKTLVGEHTSLYSSHQQLHATKSTLAEQYKVLLAKQQKAITQIESLVSKLKAIEK